MKKLIVSLFPFCFFFTINAFAQAEVQQVQAVQVENISIKLSEIAKSLNALNEKLKVFSETFSSNQGLRLTDKQQTILISFEFLNRAEQRLSNLQKTKLDLSEKMSSIRLKLAEIEDDLRPESVDRSVSLRGTTNAEEIRTIRRQALNKAKSDLNSLIDETQNTLREIDNEIRETEMFIKRIRQRIFPAIEKEISDL